MLEKEMRDRIIVLVVGACISAGAFLIKDYTSKTVEGAVTRSEVTGLISLVREVASQQATTANVLEGIQKTLVAIQKDDSRQDAELREMRSSHK